MTAPPTRTQSGVPVLSSVEPPKKDDRCGVLGAVLLNDSDSIRQLLLTAVRGGLDTAWPSPVDTSVSVAWGEAGGVCGGGRSW